MICLWKEYILINNWGVLVKIYAFVGPSGTGKSHRAQWVAREREIEGIIDDGLLIRGNKVLAGFSAKKEPTKIASIRRALFTEESHTEDVKNAIKVYQPKSILIIGTSDGMINTIIKALGLPEITEWIRIEDVATELEIKRALSIRKDEGKHVIPVPTFEIKRQFSGYFLDPLRIFRPKGKGVAPFEADKSVVRPTFSYLGKYVISDHAVYEMIENIALQIAGIYKVMKFRLENMLTGVVIEMDVSVNYGFYISDVLIEFQIRVKEELERLTGLNIISINILAKSLYVG